MTAENVYSGQCPNGDCRKTLSCDRSLGTFDCPYCGRPVSLETLLSVSVNSDTSADELFEGSESLSDLEHSTDTGNTDKSPSGARRASSIQAVFSGAILAVVCYRGGAWVFSHLLQQPVPYSYNEPLFLIEPIALLSILFFSAWVGGMFAVRSLGRNRIQHAGAVGLILIATLVAFSDDFGIPVWIECLSAFGGAIFQPSIQTTKGLKLGPLRPFLSWGVFSKAFAFSGLGAVYFCWQARTVSLSEILRSGLLSGFFVALAAMARSVEQTILQRDRDLNATRISRETARYNTHRRDEQRGSEATEIRSTSQREHIHGPFFLYLRPFKTTGQLNCVNPEHADGPMTPRAYTQPKSVDFETRLAAGIESLGPFIALGVPGEHFGAGRVLSTEDSWKEQFENLANRAKAIFIIPLNAPGTQWEIDWLILGGLIPKCVLIMPPQPVGDFGGMSKMWTEARDILTRKGLSLPPYSAGGALFRIGENGAISTVESVGQLSNRRLKSKLIALVNDSHHRNSSATHRIIWVLIVIVAMFVIVWAFVQWSPTVSYEPPHTLPVTQSLPVRPPQPINLPDGGVVTANRYRLERYGLDYSFPRSWHIEDVATPERMRRAVWPAEDRERLERESQAIESHAIFFAAAEDHGASLTISTEKQKADMKALDYAKENEYIFATQGVNVDGTALSHEINSRLFARIAISQSSASFTVRTVEENTVCRSYLFSFIVTASNPVDLAEAIDSLQTIRFANCGSQE